MIQFGNGAHPFAHQLVPAPFMLGKRIEEPAGDQPGQGVAEDHHVPARQSFFDQQQVKAKSQRRNQGYNQDGERQGMPRPERSVLNTISLHDNYSKPATNNCAALLKVLSKQYSKCYVLLIARRGRFWPLLCLEGEAGTLKDFAFDFQLHNYPITHLPNSQRERGCLHQNENKILVLACITN